jgi:hypothetical protein
MPDSGTSRALGHRSDSLDRLIHTFPELALGCQRISRLSCSR